MDLGVLLMILIGGGGGSGVVIDGVVINVKEENAPYNNNNLKKSWIFRISGHRSRRNKKNIEIYPRPHSNNRFHKQNFIIENQTPIFRWRR